MNSKMNDGGGGGSDGNKQIEMFNKIKTVVFNLECVRRGKSELG